MSTKLTKSFNIEIQNSYITKLTKSFNIEIQNSYISKLLIFKNKIEKVLYLIKFKRRYFDEIPSVKFYIFSDSYILYIEEINTNFNLHTTSIIDEFSFVIFSYYSGCKDIRTFEFKENLLCL